MAESPNADRYRRVIRFDDIEALRAACGERDSHLRWLEQRLDIQVLARGQEFHLMGHRRDVEHGASVLTELVLLAQDGVPIGAQTVQDLVEEPSVPVSTGLRSGVARATGRPDSAKVRELAPQRRRPPARSEDGEWLDGARLIQPRSDGQRRYVEAMRTHDLTFGIGPAGSGKTWLAVASAMAALQRREVKRIVLTRPAVEAGEHLGFLPGDLREKVSPYLQPLHDALGDMVDPDKVERMVERGQIEAAPLAFMRGRTLSHAFVIVDEAQNCTPAQLLMIMTRLGEHTRMVVTGDPSQSDLHGRMVCALEHAARVTGALEGVAVVRLGREDVVRHPLVAAIAEAWEQDRAGLLRPEGRL